MGMTLQEADRIRGGDYIELESNLGKGIVTRVLMEPLRGVRVDGQFPMIEYRTEGGALEWCTYSVIQKWAPLRIEKGSPGVLKEFPKRPESQPQEDDEEGEGPNLERWPIFFETDPRTASAVVEFLNENMHSGFEGWSEREEAVIVDFIKDIHLGVYHILLEKETEAKPEPEKED